MTAPASETTFSSAMTAQHLRLHSHQQWLPQHLRLHSHQQWLPSIWDYILISNDCPASETTLSSAMTAPAPKTTLSSAMTAQHLRLHSHQQWLPQHLTLHSHQQWLPSIWDYILISKDYPPPRRFCIGFRDEIVMDWHSSQYPLDPGVVFHYRVLRGTYNIVYILFLEFWQHAIVCLGSSTR